MKVFIAKQKDKINLKLEGHFDVKGIYAAFLQKLYEPKTAMAVAWVRIVIFGMFIYKLLSRDFSNFGFAPKEIFDIYPAGSFETARGWYILGNWPIVDTVTFHWIHWFLPMPDEQTLVIIQSATLFCCVITLLFGRGPYRAWAIASYVLLSYLWGFLWRTAGGEDAVFVAFGIILFYCFSSHKETMTLSMKNAPLLETTKENGWFFSMCILVFINYYFLSGVNKLVQIPIVDWLTMDALKGAKLHYYAATLGFPRGLAPGTGFISQFHLIDLVGVPLTYASHLLFPLIFFKRKLIYNFWIFYMLFHYMAWAMGLLFAGLMITWFIFLPVDHYYRKLTGVSDPSDTALLK